MRALITAARFALILMLTSVSMSGALAQGTPPPPPAGASSNPPQAESKSLFRDPEDGMLDASQFLEMPHTFLPVPIVITEPAIGYGAGVAGMFLRPREEAGDQGWSLPNISVLGAFGTENDTWGAFGADASRWIDGRLETLAGGATGRINLDFYGLGLTEASLDEPVRYSLDFTGVLLQGNWHFKAQSPWSLGLRYVYVQVEPMLRGEQRYPGLLDRIAVDISAPAAVVEYDSRDNVFTPTRGVYAESLFLASREALGASVDFERFQQVLMGWWPIADAVTLGMRADYQWASDGSPFFAHPYVRLRGVEAMRYQGNEMASAEVEARWQFLPRWSVLTAAGYGATHSSEGRFSGSQDVASGAVGLRYMLARKFGLHAGLDVAFSSDTTAVYIQIGNAWFRP